MTSTATPADIAIRTSRAATPADVADHYDDLDGFYRAIWGEHVHHGLWRTGLETDAEAVEQLARHVAAAVRVQRGDRVGDIGCGYGATARLLAREMHAVVTGITVSRAQHAHAAGRPTPGVRFVLGDWTRNDFPDAAFDRAIAIESTEHMADKPACMRQAFRVLRPGGRIAVCAWLAGREPRRWEVAGLLEPICREGRLPGMGTDLEYRALLEQAGFRNVTVEDLTERVKPTWSRCIVRALGEIRRSRRIRDYLRARSSRNREFALTLARIWLAYETGAMRYGLFAGDRPRNVRDFR